jgi:hypothetical protein
MDNRPNTSIRVQEICQVIRCHGGLIKSTRAHSNFKPFRRRAQEICQILRCHGEPIKRSPPDHLAQLSRRPFIRGKLISNNGIAIILRTFDISCGWCKSRLFKALRSGQLAFDLLFHAVELGFKAACIDA